MTFQIHTKNGRRATIEAVFDAYQRLYPEKYRYLKDRLRKLWEVQKNPNGHFRDRKGRDYRITLRVPTELFLFLQHRIPGFGEDYEDIKLLMQVGKDFCSMDRAPVNSSQRVQGFKKGDDESHAAHLGNDDRSGKARTPAQSARKPQEKRPPPE